MKADTSVENRPMARAFERGGYRTFATRQEFSAELRQRVAQTRV